MLDTRFLRGSDGTGLSVLARINTQRLIGSSVLKVDSVSKWPTGQFIATAGTLNSNGYLDPSLGAITEFRGHITAGDIIIDSYEAGSSDVGNLVNQYVMIKQTVGWANLVQDSLAELQDQFITRGGENFADYIETGGVWAALAGLNAGMSAVTAYQAGQRATLAAVATRAFTASRDTYVDLLRGGTTLAPTLTLVYTEQVNGTAPPALAPNSIRLAKVVTGAAAITYIAQYGKNNTVRTNPQNPMGDFGVYEELARVTINTAIGDVNTGTIKPKRYLKMLINIKCGGTTRIAAQFNGDTGANYSDNYSLWDGNAFGTDINQTFAALYGGLSGAGDVINCTSEWMNQIDFHKLGIVNTILSGFSAASGGIPQTLWDKWANNTAPISSIRVFNRDAALFQPGSEIVVLGHD